MYVLYSIVARLYRRASPPRPLPARHKQHAKLRAGPPAWYPPYMWSCPRSIRLTTTPCSYAGCGDQRLAGSEPRAPGAHLQHQHRRHVHPHTGVPPMNEAPPRHPHSLYWTTDMTSTAGRAGLLHAVAAQLSTSRRGVESPGVRHTSFVSQLLEAVAVPVVLPVLGRRACTSEPSCLFFAGPVLRCSVMRLGERICARVWCRRPCR